MDPLDLFIFILFSLKFKKITYLASYAFVWSIDELSIVIVPRHTNGRFYPHEVNNITLLFHSDTIDPFEKYHKKRSRKIFFKSFITLYNSDNYVLPNLVFL